MKAAVIRSFGGPEVLLDPGKVLGFLFGYRSTAREVIRGIDLAGKRVVVTGGYSGIGLETTRALAEEGATVIVPARTPDKARAALAGIPNVEQASLDLADPASKMVAGVFRMSCSRSAMPYAFCTTGTPSFAIS